MKQGDRVLAQIFPFKCQFATCSRRYKYKRQLSFHLRSHKGTVSQTRKSLTLCRTWVNYKNKKRHQQNVKTAYESNNSNKNQSTVNSFKYRAVPQLLVSRNSSFRPFQSCRSSTIKNSKVSRNKQKNPLATFVLQNLS